MGKTGRVNVPLPFSPYGCRPIVYLSKRNDGYRKPRPRFHPQTACPRATAQRRQTDADARTPRLYSPTRHGLLLPAMPYEMASHTGGQGTDRAGTGIHYRDTYDIDKKTAAASFVTLNLSYECYSLFDAISVIFCAEKLNSALHFISFANPSASRLSCFVSPDLIRRHPYL